MAIAPLPILPASGSGCGSSCGGCASGGHDDEASRRDFLRNATTVTLGAMSLTLLAGASPSNAPAPHGGSPAGPGGAKPMWGFLVDTTKCIGAGKCLTACRVENSVP